jgi:hypothetical protein
MQSQIRVVARMNSCLLRLGFAALDVIVARGVAGGWLPELPHPPIAGAATMNSRRGLAAGVVMSRVPLIELAAGCVLGEVIAVCFRRRDELLVDVRGLVVRSAPHRRIYAAS